jgi:hypothetical protein
MKTPFLPGVFSLQHIPRCISWAICGTGRWRAPLPSGTELGQWSCFFLRISCGFERFSFLQKMCHHLGIEKMGIYSVYILDLSVAK